jgi:hypothetical protein
MKAKTYRERNYNKSNLLYKEKFSDDAMLLFQAKISLRISNVLDICLWKYSQRLLSKYIRANPFRLTTWAVKFAILPKLSRYVTPMRVLVSSAIW